jgi:hemerythrin-like domain-containing protein
LPHHDKLANKLELIGLLIREHLLIEQIITPLKTELKHSSQQNTAHPQFIYNDVDFFRTYVDKFHHGKEEDVLFLELSKKKLEPEHLRVMNELEEDHRYARRTEGDLVKATGKWSPGEHQIIDNISDNLRKLIELYPRQLEKEDKHFSSHAKTIFPKRRESNYYKQDINSIKN